jgi:DNA topoisomerase-1
MFTRKLNEAGDKFLYYDGADTEIIDESILKRIKHLKIPPMWTGVQISEDPTDYLQCTGEDSTKRQYIYHPLFISITQNQKYENLKKFCKKLPKIKRRIKTIITSFGLDPEYNVIKDAKEYQICMLLAILFRSYIRVGNDKYADNNSTYGLCTLRKSHVIVSGSKIILDFSGKWSQDQYIEFTDRHIAKYLLLLKKNNNSKDMFFVKSYDINKYLNDITECNFTAKDFRLYASNRLFIEMLCKLSGSSDPQEQKQISSEKILRTAYKMVSEELGNSPEICKKSYVLLDIAHDFKDHREKYVKGADSVKILTDLI